MLINLFIIVCFDNFEFNAIFYSHFHYPHLCIIEISIYGLHLPCAMEGFKGTYMFIIECHLVLNKKKSFISGLMKYSVNRILFIVVSINQCSKCTFLSRLCQTTLYRTHVLCKKSQNIDGQVQNEHCKVTLISIFTTIFFLIKMQYCQNVFHPSTIISTMFHIYLNKLHAISFTGEATQRGYAIYQ